MLTQSVRVIILTPMLNPMMEQEVYKSVTAGELEIDSNGRVWRVMRRIQNRWGKPTLVKPCKRIRAEMKNAAGYLQVRVMRDKRRYYASAARLVWFHCNGAIPQGITINHKNGIKDDNRPENLELATYVQQRIHAIRVLGARHHDVRGERHPKAQATEAIVKMIRKKHDVDGQTETEIASQVGMTRRAVWAICHRKTWRHIP